MKNIHQGMRLSGVDIEIRQGEVVGLAGLLGSGRTELAQVLFGMNPPDAGEIFWWGEKAEIHSPSDAIKKVWAFVLKTVRWKALFHICRSEKI